MYVYHFHYQAVILYFTFYFVLYHIMLHIYICSFLFRFDLSLDVFVKVEFMTEVTLRAVNGISLHVTKLN